MSKKIALTVIVCTGIIVAYTLLTPILCEPALFLEPFVGTRELKSHVLIVITPVSRPDNPEILTSRMLLLRQCIDVRWIVVSCTPTLLPKKAFKWITQIVPQPSRGGFGNIERNAALDYIATDAQLQHSDGFLYFLDDNNLPPSNLCENLQSLDAQVTYFGDQFGCGSRLRLPSTPDMMTSLGSDLVGKVDTGMFLVSLSMWRSVEYHEKVAGRLGLRWTTSYHHDKIFFSQFLNSTRSSQGIGWDQQFRHLHPSKVQFLYNAITC